MTRSEDRSTSALRSSPLPRTRLVGVGLACATAAVSGVAVFVNGYAVKRFPDPTTYTTAKNLVAALALVALAVAATRARSEEGLSRPQGRREWLGLVAVGVVGGSAPFVLFFEGLSRASSTDAAFIHKTLVVWVALLAVPLLGERLGWPHIAAIAMLIGGHAVLASDPASIAAGAGEAMVLAATLLWAAEVVLAKWLLRSVTSLTVGVARMGFGVVLLILWAGLRGELATLVELTAAAWAWALLTGVILTAYVVTWYAGLARAQAVDVTAVLVGGAVLTAVLDTGVNGVPLADPLGLSLIAAGTALVAVVAGRNSRGAPAR